VDAKMSVEIEVPERPPQTCGLHEKVDAHIVPEGLVACGLHVVEYREGDIRIDVKCRSSCRPIARAFLAMNRTPRKRSPGQIEIASARFGRVEGRASPPQGVRGYGR